MGMNNGGTLTPLTLTDGSEMSLNALAIYLRQEDETTSRNSRSEQSKMETKDQIPETSMKIKNRLKGRKA